ncbi:MAG: TonB-dependent receptor [Gammaproteobacteria bacterium]|jgi:iron complex outermembrane receptor protein|nr:TonB-dependent receptor [Gammaproteobacteria bacterium]MBK8991764.1 TonB-dependent receptor [Gammaproteobacteria bacterium]MBK9468660.1 TonB-dependent receptor [Gammaproteobacteria bacterium]MBP6481395.1 TonB-dependent receptor [Pseudomonadales bacterium]MBP7911609.1 TonB-dependent receptor [Pseudomonadales bacterium]
MAIRIRRFAPTVLAMAVAGAAAPWAQAQQDGARATGLEEVIVTAERREASLQDTPISVLAFGADMLEKLNVDDLGDIQFSVPNLSMRQFPNSQASLRTYMRGVGNNDVGMSTDPSVGVYIDGIYMARSIGLGSEVASLERIEVLRGPQGSLYGRNTIGGAINMITAKPKGEWGFKGGLSAGDRDYVKARAEVDTARVAGLAAKLSLMKSEKDGWIENDGRGPNFGDNDSAAGRLAINWSPSDNFSADYAYDYSDVDSGTIYYQNIGPSQFGFESVPFRSDRQDNVRPRVPFEESNVEVSGHSLTLAWEISDDLTLKSLTGYREVEQDIYQDYGANPVTTRLFANAPFLNEQDQFSQEFQLLGKLMDGGLEYVLGAYYFEEEGDEDTIDYITLPLAYYPPYPPDMTLNEFELPRRVSTANNDATALYGHFTWTPAALEQLHLTLGVRYSEDEREIETAQYASGFQFFSTKADDTWDNTSADFTVSYDISDDVNVYGKYVEGYKTGGFNIRGTSVVAATTPVSEETVGTWEAGIKSQFLDDRVRLNAALFTSDYEDIQLSFAAIGDPTNTVLYNAGKASIDGAELDLTALITDSLVLTLGYGYLDTSVDEVIDPATGANLVNTAKYALPSAPENSFTADLDYTFPSFGYGELVLNVNYASIDESEFVSTPTFGYNIPEYDLWNARLTLRELCLGEGRAAVAIWGKNLADEEYLLDGIESFPWSQMVAPFGESRTWGVDLTYEY